MTRSESLKLRFAAFRDGALPLSWGGTSICLLMLASSLAICFVPTARKSGLVLWTFARPHFALYEPVCEAWNRDHTPKLNVFQLGLRALEQRMLSSFVTATPSADLIEVERGVVGGAFSGPLEDVGFVDLTDRMRQDGLMEELNPPSISPWTSRGRIFGLPHDVHPVLLAYLPRRHR
jgi:arabinosaccharide transport system substrate-binding protein